MSRKVLNEGRIGTFCIEDVVLDNGHETRLEVLYHPGAAAVLTFVDDDKVLMLRQYRHAIREWLWEIPAGKLDPGETPEACVARELEEETGYRPAVLESLGSIVTAPGFTDEVIHLFLARDLKSGTINRGPGEQIEMHEIAYDEAVAMIARGEIHDGKTLAAFLRYSLR